MQTGAQLKVTEAHSTFAEPEEKASSGGEKSKGMDNVIEKLSAQVEALTRAMETLKNQLATQTQVSGRFYQTAHQSGSGKNRPERKTQRPYGCPQCIAQALPDCNHCFSCGEEGHHSIGCLKNPK